jgi:hypothetical protein
VSAGFIPQGEFDPVPESKLVEDDAKMVFDHELGRADGFGYLAIFESSGDSMTCCWRGLGTRVPYRLLTGVL